MTEKKDSFWRGAVIIAAGCIAMGAAEIALTGVVAGGSFGYYTIIGSIGTFLVAILVMLWLSGA